MKKLLLLCLTVGSYVSIQVKGGTGDNGNAAAFNAICGVYMIAKELAERDTPIELSTTHSRGQLGEITNLYTLTADDVYFDEGPQPGNDVKETPETTKERLKNWKEGIRSMLDSRIINMEGKEVKKYIRPPASRARLLAHRKIKRIQGEAQKLVEQIDLLSTQALSKKKDIKRLALDAIFGEGQDKPAGSGAKTFEDDYAHSCGDGVTGHASGPGKSLANDMVCLCLGTSHVTGVLGCGQTWATAGLATTSFSGEASGEAAFNKVKSGCYQDNLTGQDAVNEILGNLAAFRAQIGAKAENSAATDLILGGGSASGCTGGTNPQQYCVNYKNQLTQRNFDGIKWYSKMRELAGRLKMLEANQTKIAVLQNHLEHLVELAEQSYLEAEQGVKEDTTAPPDPAKEVAPAASPEKNTLSTNQGAVQSLTYASALYTVLGFVL